MIKVRRGENFPLSVRTSELKIVSRLTVRRNGTQEIFRYCSPEEQNHGCKPINPERFSLQILKDNVSVTVLDANTSDEGVYDVEVIDDKHDRIQQKFTVVLTEQPFTTPAISTKGEETHPTTTVSTERNHKVTWGLAGVIAVAIVVIFGIICCKKKKQGSADDDLENPLKQLHSNTNTNGVGEPATDEVLETVDETNCSVDNEEGPENGSTGQRNL